MMARLHTLPNVRKPRGVRHAYGTVLAIALAAIAVGCTSLLAIGEWASGLSQEQLATLKGATFPRVNPPFGERYNGARRRSWIVCGTVDGVARPSGGHLGPGQRAHRAPSDPDQHRPQQFQQLSSCSTSVFFGAHDDPPESERNPARNRGGAVHPRSDKLSPDALLKAVRLCWTIENKVHWARDVNWREDPSPVRTGAASHVLASLRNAV